MEINVMFRLLDKKVDEDSHFVNQDGSKDLTKKIDFTNRYGVLNPYWVLGASGGREFRRYIQGCPIFDPAEQDKQKYIADLTNSIVEFKAGGDIMVDEAVNPLLVKWLKEHPNNISSKNHNPDKHDRQFFTYDPKDAVKAEVTVATAEDEAMEIVISLKKDPERLRAVANLFAETSGRTDEGEIYLELRRLAKDNPSNFTQSIASREKAVLGDVLLARKYTVINRNAKGYYYEGTEGSIFEPESKKEKDADEELVKFLMSKEGADHYKQMLVKIQQKELEINSPAGEKKEK